MQNPDIDNNDEKPLDPTMEKVRRKMIRLLGVSLGVMFIGVMAVLAAVVYKIRTSGDEEAQTAVAQSVSNRAFVANLDVILPADFQVQGFNLDGARGAVHGVDQNGVSQILIIDLTNGEIISTVNLRN
ncbi:MAG: hypothetical protein ABJN11_08145 [Lentilitoribacter sp.]|mmetsp:Transcript_8719/g.11372  ORF Transcript_8719/g.11372 Transcript_8719/m.11372 type:complete len:128 (-) Transcript_8719:58-441(-)